MNQRITLITIIISSLLLSACSLTPVPKPAEIQTDNSISQQAVRTTTNETKDQEPTSSPQPTVSQSTELGDLEQELNDTQILEEDFSDL